MKYNDIIVVNIIVLLCHIIIMIKFYNNIIIPIHLCIYVFVGMNLIVSELLLEGVRIYCEECNFSSGLIVLMCII